MSIDDLPVESASISDTPIETLPDGRVVIAGGGPVGLLLALTLAHHGVRSTLLERSLETTCFPKMDLTLARTMEIFRVLGLAEEIRARGVPSKYPFTVRFSSGLKAEHTLSTWKLPSVDEFRERIKANNDGSQPLEPWQRISGDVVEALLKEKCEQSALVELRCGWKVTAASELEKGAEVTAINPETSKPVLIRSQYLAGCEGASSVVRKSLGIEMDGGQMYSAAVLVHFKSKDLNRIHQQGHFWHTFFPSDPKASGGSLGGAIVSQDERETWTVHDFLMPGTSNALTPEETIYRVLGGMGEPFQINIDEIIAQSTYKPTIAIAKNYSSPNHHIFLAGDSCHQTIPSGGYGMNLGLTDAFDLGWKLAAKIHGWGGPLLLASYEEERRPVAELMLHWSKIHGKNLMNLSTTVDLVASTIDSPCTAGQTLREAIDEYIQSHDGHNQSFGVEMGHRYQSCIILDAPDKSHSPAPPTFNPRTYTPTTYPGYRAPHVFLKSGLESIHAHFSSRGFTLLHFTSSSPSPPPPPHHLSLHNHTITITTTHHQIPLKLVTLSDEDHAAQIYEAKYVLVRPDGFVAWRGDEIGCLQDVERILLRAAGYEAIDGVE